MSSHPAEPFRSFPCLTFHIYCQLQALGCPLYMKTPRLREAKHVASEDKGDLSTGMSDSKAQALTCISRSGFAFDKAHFGFFLVLGAFKKKSNIKTKPEQ